jgi:hypothetical protein
LLYKNINIKLYRTIILLIILYVCGTWSFTFRAKLKTRTLEKEVARKIFGPKRDEVTEEWRRLHN